MGRIIENKPNNLSDRDWSTVLAACPGDANKALLLLKEAQNEPIAASQLFTGTQANYGHELANNHLRKAGLPFRLTRIGRWVKGDRHERKLAVVPWPTK